MQSLSDSDREAILKLARQALIEAVCHNRLLQPFLNTGIFARRCGVFVSLHVNKRLRGCIGVVEPHETLGECLVKSTIGAAMEDPRFSRVLPEEIPGIHIEVSLLSPLQPTQPEEIEIGRDGLLVACALRRGLLLPQVAVEHHLDRERFLEETCVKAGLPRYGWKQPEAKIYRFTCEIISEDLKSPTVATEPPLRPSL